MTGSTRSKVTTDHEEIRRWAAARNGTPVAIIHSKTDDDSDGPIRICFPGDGSEHAWGEITWRDWFKQFDAAQLAFLYQELTAGGEKSNFNKVVSRETVDEVESAVGGKGRSASRRKSRRAPGIGAIATLPKGEPQRAAKYSAGRHKVSKKSTATIASVVSRKKQPPMGKASRDKNS